MNYIGPRGYDTFRAVALGVGTALNDERLEKLHSALLSTRTSGRIACSVVTRTFERLARYPDHVQRSAVDIYLERGGNEGEKYLLGIAKGEKSRLAPFRDGISEAAPPPSAAQQAAEHLDAVLEKLRLIYVGANGNREPLRAAGIALRALRDEAERLSAKEIDVWAEAIEKRLRETCPDLPVPHFSPWWV